MSTPAWAHAARARADEALGALVHARVKKPEPIRAPAGHYLAQGRQDAEVVAGHERAADGFVIAPRSIHEVRVIFEEPRDRGEEPLSQLLHPLAASALIQHANVDEGIRRTRLVGIPQPGR